MPIKKQRIQHTLIVRPQIYHNLFIPISVSKVERSTIVSNMNEYELRPYMIHVR